jgi:acetylglutamate kinase
LYSVIKIGGSTLANLQKSFFSSIRSKVQQGEKIVIVHGAGPEINKQLQTAGIPVQVKDGIRITCQETLEIVKNSLGNTANGALVERLKEEGIPAASLSGCEMNCIVCDYLEQEVYGFVGKVKYVDTSLIEKIIKAGQIPVIPSLGTTENGQAVNINADIAAGEIASALHAKHVCFVTDTQGVRINEETKQAVRPDQLDEWIKNGDIFGGMIPKVKAAMDCLKIGIPEVSITDQSLKGTYCYKEALAK